MDSGTDIVRAAADLAARVARGDSPGNWQEAELVLATVVLMYADPARLGGTKRNRAGEPLQHPAITSLATAVGRTEDAVVLKVMNLRACLTGGLKGMSHGARLDGWAVNAFAGRLDDLVIAAEAVASLLPGAVEMLDALIPGAARPESQARPGPVIGASGVHNTEVLRERAVRNGQGLFRGRVMANYAHTCAFCGLHSRMPDRNSYLLVASHIRPWAASSDHQRLDFTNGLSLCALHDRAFEWGFLTVDEGLRVVASSHAREHYEPDERVAGEILSLHGEPLKRPGQHYTPPGEGYLAYHREQVFEKRFAQASDG